MTLKTSDALKLKQVILGIFFSDVSINLPHESDTDLTLVLVACRADFLQAPFPPMLVFTSPLLAESAAKTL